MLLAIYMYVNQLGRILIIILMNGTLILFEFVRNTIELTLKLR